MKSYITTSFAAGIGSTYDTIYRLFVTQQQLKSLGYETKIYVNFGLNPYKTNTHDRSVFYKIFKLELLDNLNLMTEGFDAHQENFPERNECQMILNNDRIYYVYVDEIVDGVENLENFNLWQNRDDLPKLSFLTDEIVEYAENRLKEIGDDFVCIQYRPFELNNQDIELDLNKQKLNTIIEENKNEKVLLFSQFEIVKNYYKSQNIPNLYINDYEFPTDFNKVRGLGWDDERLLNYFKETLFEMYAFSKAKKIYHICSWFSNFLFYSTTYNQTNLSNKDRYFPPYN